MANSREDELENGDSDVESRVASLAIEISRKLPQRTVGVLRGPSIWRVHRHLKRAEREAYEPKLVSIGPLHRKRKELLPMEQVKRAYLVELLHRNPDNCLKRYIRRILYCLPDVKREYSETIALSDDDLAEMLVVDGCFIIEYFARRLFRTNKKMPFLPQVRWGFSILKRDLLLLENQIPFFVLTILLEETMIPMNYDDLKKLASQVNMPEKESLDLMLLAIPFLGLELPCGKYPKQDEVLHLLHLKHLCLEPGRIDNREGCSFRLALWPVKKVKKLISVLLFGLFYLIFFRDCPPIFCGAQKSTNQYMIPCATKLLDAGIKFTRKTFSHEFEEACQLEVSFCDGTLEIPFLLVSDSTSTELRNLIALEQSCSHVKSSHFTSYCVFMDNIIDTTDDVAILRSRGILESMLGTDAEVAKLFSRLCREVTLDTKEHCNAELFKNVREFCQFSHHRWRAKLVHTRFRNPWTLISLLGAILLLALTATQTYLALFPRQSK